jgi:hypothetical protein
MVCVRRSCARAAERSGDSQLKAEQVKIIDEI